MSVRIILMLSAFLILWAASSEAHVYVPNDGSHVDAANALPIDDPTLSQVVYHELTPPASQLWLELDGTPGQQVYVQLGVPVLESLDDFRPAIAIVGPGLPDVGLPIDIPEGLGAALFETQGVEGNRFDEHFTGTSSWILLEETVELPDAGTYYVVAFHPASGAGKLWVSVGQRERFGIGDILAFEAVVDAVREFHEVQSERLPALPRALVFVSRVLRLILWPFGFRPAF